MVVFSKSIKELVDDYKGWVCRNPSGVKSLEGSFTVLCVFLAGKINKSWILTEWVATASSLLNLFNQQIVYSSRQRTESPSNKLKVCVNVLEYCEFVLEKSAQYLWDEKGKWNALLLLHLMKCLAKFTLLLHFKERVILYPCAKIDNRLTNSSSKDYNAIGGGNDFGQVTEASFILKRSGRIVRKVALAPSLHNRTWKPPSYVECPNWVNSKEKFDIQLIAEIINVLKPLVNLGVVMKFGFNSWRPWITSLLMDLISLYLIDQPPEKPYITKFTVSERQELSRRRLWLLLYLLRSPLYERNSKNVIETLIRFIPFVGPGFLERYQYLLSSYSFLWSK